MTDRPAPPRPMQHASPAAPAAPSRRIRWVGLALLAVGLLCLLPATAAYADRIGDITESSMLDRLIRFFTFRDASLRYALLGSMLLGVCCGLMGSFLVVRKLALMGDALSHAVLPGVALGFLWSMEKDPVAIFVGAVVVGLLGAGVVQLVRNTTRHKEDAALGFVLASFFGVGICLFTMIQNLPGGNKSGLDKFMFGQAAALGRGDVILLAVVAGVTLLAILVFFKEFAVTSFDPGFARAYGLPVQVFHYGLMLLLAFAIVSALQAVGVVLVSAMLVIPAATAYLLTDRLDRMLILAALVGLAAGAIGAFFSFVGRNLPTGPFMVLAGGTVFFLALFFAPRHGMVARWWRQRSRAARIRREHTAMALYRALEMDRFQDEAVPLETFCQVEGVTFEEGRELWRELAAARMITVQQDAAYFTQAGWQRACELVRNHRLWELYLTHAAQIPASQVHEEADRVEHVLGESVVQQLEQQLDYARLDPHGKPIPGIEDIQAGPTGMARVLRENAPS